MKPVENVRILASMGRFQTIRSKLLRLQTQELRKALLLPKKVEGGHSWIKDMNSMLCPTISHLLFALRMVR